jgi:hypothetical protein
VTIVIRALCASLALAVCAVRPAYAQAENRGGIEGTVTDSVHARPLAGARVVAVRADSVAGTPSEARTDTLGRYRIDSLPAGRYLVGFESPLLDSLEVTLSPREAMVSPARTATVDLAIPSATKLRAAVCPGVNFGEGTGIVFGHVVNAATDGPLPGAVLALRWRELDFDREKLRPVNEARSASVTTDAGGWYRVCGVPTGAWVSMQIEHAGRVGPVIRAMVDDTLGIAIQHLSFAATAARDTAAPPDSAAEQPATGSATLTGVVRGPGGLPISAAEVRVRGTTGAGMTDEQGSYTLRDLPAGTQELDVRKIGYAVAELTVNLRDGATTATDVRMQRIVSLDSMRVVATRTRYPEFSQHRKFGLGATFLGPEDIMRQHVSWTSDIVQKIPGFLIDRRRGRARVVSARGPSSMSQCVANVVIDGMPLLMNGPDDLSVDDVHPSDVGAIEAYRAGDVSAPPDYDRGCGAIVIWTKR